LLNHTSPPKLFSQPGRFRIDRILEYNRQERDVMGHQAANEDSEGEKARSGRCNGGVMLLVNETDHFVSQRQTIAG
jgi:hypothetical protein